MGSKLTSVRERSSEAKEGVDAGLEKARDDAQEMSTVREALDRVPGNADDDIAALKESVEQSSVQEAISSMESGARAELDSAKATGDEAINEAETTAEGNREAAEAYGSVSDTRFAGGAADAQSRAESDADELDSLASDTEAALEQGDSDYADYLAEIEG